MPLKFYRSQADAVREIVAEFEAEIGAEDLWTDWRTEREHVSQSDRIAFLAGVEAGRRNPTKAPPTTEGKADDPPPGGRIRRKGPEKLLFGIDFDGTFSADPGLFRAFVKLLRERGHDAVLVTGRSDEGRWGADVRREVNGLMPIVFAGTATGPGTGMKQSAAEAAGYRVDVWIDDHPESVGSTRRPAMTRERAEEVADYILSHEAPTGRRVRLIAALMAGTSDLSEHDWVRNDRYSWTYCSRCGKVQSADRKTMCSGSLPKVALRGLTPPPKP